MLLLLDTNVLVRLVSPADPDHVRVVDALTNTLVGHHFVLGEQCLFEFWAVATRPRSSNGFGLTPEQAEKEIVLFMQTFPLFDWPKTLLSTWLKICSSKGVSGKNSHDARLVAFMICHGIDGIITLNPQDFARFPEIQVLVP